MTRHRSTRPILSYDDVRLASETVLSELLIRPHMTAQGALLRLLEVLRYRHDIRVPKEPQR